MAQPAIEGIQMFHTPVFKTEDYSPEMMAMYVRTYCLHSRNFPIQKVHRRYQLYASGKIEAFMELYSQMLDCGVSAFGTIFRHVRDKPTERFLFHCTGPYHHCSLEIFPPLMEALSGERQNRSHSCASSQGLFFFNRIPAVTFIPLASSLQASLMKTLRLITHSPVSAANRFVK